MTRSEKAGPPITSITAQAYRIPTDKPEADGTLSWNATTMVVVNVHAGGKSGLGYSYVDACAASLINSLLDEHLSGRDSFDIPTSWHAMQRAVRNNGRQGITACAISAVDVA